MSRRFTKVARASLGKTGFVAHSRDLIESAAWRTAPVNTKRFVEFLEVQHIKHGGRENGELRAPYDELVAAGIGRRFIGSAIKDAEHRGLVVTSHRGGLCLGAKADPSRFRLTYLQWVMFGANGPDWIPPSHDWRKYREPPKKLRAPRPRRRDGRFLRLVYSNPTITAD